MRVIYLEFRHTKLESQRRLRMSWQDEFRQLFPITRDKAYANIAYTSPLSPRVMGNNCLNSSCQVMRNPLRQTIWHAGILGI